MEDWVLEFDFDREIIEIWDGVIEKHEGNHYVVRNAEYNSTIAPGESVSIGIKGCDGESDDEPQNYHLYEMSYRKDEELVITFNVQDNMLQYKDIEGYVIVDKVEIFDGTISLKDSAIQTIDVKMVAGFTEIPQNVVTIQNGIWCIVEPQMLIGDNKFVITVYSKDGRYAEFSTHIWNTSEDNMNLLNVDKQDTDEDGLLNYQEAQYGTNINSKDTDEDGFSDIDEIFLLDTDPLVFTDDDDNDFDGLTNKEELAINTDVKSDDTDSDGLSDYDEVMLYGTDPKSVDTDKDDVTDLIEVKMGMNPCVAERLTEMGMVELKYSPYVEDADVQAILDISLLPEQLESLEVSEVDTDDAVLSYEIPGYLGSGSAYDFSLNGDFAKATLTFELSEAIMSREGFEPGIYYYNEQTQMLEELENAIWEGNTISVELEHFSRYILLNKLDYGHVWQYVLHYDDTGVKKTSLDIVFVIDSSGSMGSNDYTGIRKKVTKDFISKLTNNDRAAVVDFDSYASVYSGFTNDKQLLCSAVDKINSSGGTNLSRGISAALNLFTSEKYSDDSKQKCIIMLTDGAGSYNTLYTTSAKNQDVTIYTVGLGSSVSKSVLTNMAEGTGGSYFHASEADKLYNVFDNIIELTDLYKDSDQDGVSDYHEKAMASGVLRLGTGISLLGMDYLDDDSDDDGILDGKEIIVSQLDTIVYVKMNSNSTKKDTDDDGLNDSVECEVINTNIGNHKLNPLKKDTDNDGISDSEELGSFREDLGYYRVNSNPFMKEEFSLGNDSPVSFIFANIIDNPTLAKEKYSEGIMPNGKAYIVYTFLDTSTFNFTKRKLIEVGESYEKEYYLLFADTGNTVRGGQGDEIYRKAVYEQFSERLITSSSFVEIGLNAKFAKEDKPFLGVDSNPEDFLYYDNSKGEFLTVDEWKTVHFEERFDLNCCYDKYLPITSYEAVNMGFEKLPMDKSKYHIPAGIKTEIEKGATHKYITTDGLEAIYEVLIDATSVESITNNYQGTKMLPLQDYPKIGPTFNYAPNDDGLTSDASIAHYYFDMIPFYWWGGVRD